MSRTVVNLRDDLVEKARKLSGIRKKVELVDLALQEFVRHREIHRSIMEMEGRVKWEGDIRWMRRDRKIDFG